MGGMEVIPGRKGEPGSSVSAGIKLNSCVKLVCIIAHSSIAVLFFKVFINLFSLLIKRAPLVLQGSQGYQVLRDSLACLGLWGLLDSLSRLV